MIQKINLGSHNTLCLYIKCGYVMKSTYKKSSEVLSSSNNANTLQFLRDSSKQATCFLPEENVTHTVV